MMTEREIDLLAQRICFYAKNDDELLEKVAKFIGKSAKPEPRLVSTKTAAEIIGISEWQLYHIKDDEDGKPQFTYVKTGKSKSARLKFDASVIREEYERFLAKKKNTLRLAPRYRKVAGL